MFLFRLRARRQIGEKLRNGYCVQKLLTLFGVESAPHGDTLNDAFVMLAPDQVQAVVTGMTETLIRKKVLYPYRLFDKYYVVAVDGTGTLTFGKRHCPHCLTQTRNGKTIYYHSVLEAKLVTPEGLAFSLITEFIENPGPKVRKQDCELKAFYRLAVRLKRRFPRLPILLSLDGLFAGGPTFEICRKNKWKFMIVLKDKDLPSVNEEFLALSQLQLENHLLMRTGKHGEIEQDFRWVDNISYLDTERREHTLSVIQCIDTRSSEEENKKKKRFKWITNCRVSTNNVVSLANDGGRIRWKIENQGFNVQKNGGYGLEHAYANNPTAAKIFYFLLQIAHMLAQLIEIGSLLRRVLPQAPSGKNLAFRLFEAWRNARLPKNLYLSILEGRFQIRLDSS